MNLIKFEGAIVDHELDSAAFELCGEFQERQIPFICCNAPPRLQGLAARRENANYTVWKLARIIMRTGRPTEDVPKRG